MPQNQKKPGKPKKATEVSFRVLDTRKYKDDGETHSELNKIEAMIEEALVTMTRSELYERKDEVVVLSTVSLSDNGTKLFSLADHFIDMKKLGYKYVLNNNYWWKTRNRMKGKYNMNNRLDFFKMIEVMPNVVPPDFVQPFHIESAVEFRHLFKNKNCQKTIYELFRKKQGTILYDDSGILRAEKVGEVFDIGYFYNVMHLRRDHGIKPPPRYIKFNKFLLERGFPKKGRMVLPERLHKGDVPARTYGRNEHRWYTENFDSTGWTIEDIKRKKLTDLQPLLRIFPHKTKGKIRMIEDIWVSINGQRNMFELFSSGLHIKFKKELRHLATIGGRNKRHVYLSVFLVCLLQGYCDVHNSQSIKVVIEFKETGIIGSLFGENIIYNDKVEHKLPCCENSGHYMMMAAFNAEANLRRVRYNNLDTDGECCYRYMLKKCLETVNIEK